ncbi:MAG TPA: methyltransferase domain-containing protein [Caulobacteraceae bacterium]|nr:methyltransferase domain-containing protein [Caulobacteraceae bacterium]
MIFYLEPRLVTHVDDAAIAALTDLYRAVLPAGGVILDLMSSWVSHLPDDVAYREVIGHGMNVTELDANPRLDRWFIRDFNREPRLPLEDASIDAAMMCVSVQYLQRPIELFADVARVLKPGAPLVVSFSNRCFPTKAVAIWWGLGESGHGDLVRLYLAGAGLADIAVVRLRDGRGSDPMTAVVGRMPNG